MDLNSYPAGTKVSIADLRPVKVGFGTFWRGEHLVPGNCVSRPAVSLEILEESIGSKKVMVEATKAAADKPAAGATNRHGL